MSFRCKNKKLGKLQAIRKDFKHDKIESTKRNNALPVSFIARPFSKVKKRLDREIKDLSTSLKYVIYDLKHKHVLAALAWIGLANVVTVAGIVTVMF